MTQLLWPLSSRLERLQPADVHVWAAATDVSRARQSVFEKWLSSDEHERAARFHDSLHARRWMAARAILRELLGHYVDAEPGALRFGYTVHGRPFLAEPPTFQLSFNVSHSAGLAVFAFSATDVGVDAEEVVELPDLREIQRHFFSSAESQALEGLDGPVYTSAFFRCWTRKEAYLKACGVGLGGAADDLNTANTSWSLYHLVPARGFVGAVATAQADSRLHCRTWAR